ncbi:hypothetical protein GQ42DRAFT_162993 [Ramicandelaber brevisporus]|nr:hypothetical protein GQ42DRAFT_162993 [Ramicandelaber brevisporus]
MSMDKGLIDTINRLQDVFTSVGLSNPIDLPQIVVVGSQSSGKSSVLENVVGTDFLPRGSGIVTRRPLILQLIHHRSAKAPAPAAQANGPASAPGSPDASSGSATTSPATPAAKPASEEEAAEWGEFLHKPGVKFYDFSKIRDEIVRDTELKTGRNAGISPLPINLRIYSPNVINLTLVDLPGLTKVPVGDQPRDIERQIRQMILQYIAKPNCIILAVNAANTDLANSDGLKMAREVDPDGLRTVGVLTKVDLMDRGTDVIDILRNRVIPLKLGYVPVINRGQKDIDTNKPISKHLEDEGQFFREHPSYTNKASFCGTPYLRERLNKLLTDHIRATLPEIKETIQRTLAAQQAQLKALGDPVNDDEATQRSAILNMISEFSNDFRSIVEGHSADLSTNELSGGARISFVFHEIYTSTIRSIDPFDQVKDADIRTILYNSAGSQPALFVATPAFDVIVKQQVHRLEDPSIRCASLVYDELLRILSQLLNKPFFRRFPQMKEKFYVCVTQFLKKCMNPTEKLVRDLISMESNYLNTAHPDFIDGHKAFSIASDKLFGSRITQPQPGARPGQAAQTIASVPNLSRNPEENQPQGFFGSFFSNRGRRPAVMEPPPAVLKASGNLSEREQLEIEVTKLLITSYFNIVKRTICDVVPKAIILNLVTQVKVAIQQELLSEIYRSEVIDELLKESDSTVSKRRELRQMIQALVKADQIINTI